MKPLTALLCAALFALFSVAAPVLAETIRPGALSSALSKAAAGDVLLLAPGDHDALRLSGVFGTPDRPVILRSADPANPARFSRLDLNAVEHLAFEDLVFDYRFTPGDNPGKLRPFQVHKSKGIRFSRVLFDGDRAQGTNSAADGFGAAFGLSLRWARDIQIENATFRTFFRGMVTGQSQGITLRDSDFYGMRSDGADFAEVRDVRIEGNHFHDFEHAPDAGDHPDMIQFWTASTKTPSTGITIRNNVLNAGMGYWTQSLFMRNEVVDRGKAGHEMFYRDVEISGNVIINRHIHGITVGQAEGLTIRNNTLIRSTTARGMAQKGDGVSTPAIRVATASEKVRIRGNLVGSIAGPEKRPDWQVRDNLAIDARTRGSALFYDRVFLSALQATSGDLGHYAYRPEGEILKTGFGSPLLNPDRVALALRGKGAPVPLLAALNGKAPPGPVAQAGLVAVDAVPGLVNRFRFTASAQGKGVPIWRLADGQDLKAQGVEVDFPTPGRHKVTMVNAQGETAVEVVIADPRILELADGTVTPAAKLPLVALPEGGVALSLGQGKDPAQLPASALRGFFNARALALDLRLRTVAGSRTPAGEVLRIHGHLGVTITPTGAAEVTLYPADMAKPVTLRSAPLRLHDGKWHDIGLRYLADKGEAVLMVDGKTVARKPARGPLRAAGSHGLSFGNPFGKKSFDGMLSDLTLIALPGQWVDVGRIARLHPLP